MAALKIAIVAGEASGDILGAGLIKAIKQQYPDTEFEGIGGPLMLEQGFTSFFAMDRLSVMGFVEPFKRLPELLRIRKFLRERYLATPPDLFLGIDYPDFNLSLELPLRKEGVLTAHYVSPSVWAWRKRRIFKIAKAVDRMLTLLPFEAQFYLQHKVPVTFVGHPLADQFPMQSDQAEARKALDLKCSGKLIALLPGSRGGEVKMLGQTFIETARWCLHQRSDLTFIIPAANDQRKQQLESLLREHGAGLPIRLIDGQSQQVMAASDVVLMASGTTTLEALLIKRPMVVAYRMARLSYAIISRLMTAPYISLPNLLAGEALVPEILQDDARPEMLGPLLLDRLHEREQQPLIERFKQIHEELRLDASNRAADVLLTMIKNKR
jgi:lipid-A-disaccharide synthase